MRKYGLNLVIILLGFLILFSCGKLERKGPAPGNVPPKVYFSDIPPEGFKFSVTPVVYWFGTDVDGFITNYQYAVMESTNVVSIGGLEKMKSYLRGIPRDSTSWVDSTSLKHMLGVHIQAEPGGNKSSVQMYADMNPDKYTPQYLFLRAVDNGGAVSDVVYKLFYRNNHRPEAFIDTGDGTFKVDPHYCLEETTATWKGIPISWSGLDTADYKDKRNQPEFKFKWELVGPFVSAPTPSIADKAPIADSSWDSILIAGSWQYSRWVSEKTHVFMGLEDFGDSVYGWYQLKVKAQDDAFTTTDTSTRMNFLIVKPRFRYADKNRKTILVVDATTYKGKAGSADTSIDVQPFYQQALSQPGLCDAFAIWYDSTSTPTASKNPPGEVILSRYDLVIVLNMGASPGITEESFKKYKDYLDIGGRLWLIGLDNFGFNASGYNNNPHYFKELGTAKNAYYLGTEYFGLDQVFVPDYDPSVLKSLEFIQAKPFGSWDNKLATLDADADLCKKLKGYANTTGYRFGVDGIPYVCYVAMSNFTDFEYRIPAGRRIFTFISNRGSLSPMQNMPCAVDYIGPTYRTAEFCFPLHLMKNDGADPPANKVIKEMVNWFWEGLPLP